MSTAPRTDAVEKSLAELERVIQSELKEASAEDGKQSTLPTQIRYGHARLTARLLGQLRNKLSKFPTKRRQRATEDYQERTPNNMTVPELIARRIDRLRDALRAESDQLRKGLERLHHECGVDLPDEGMTIPQLITSLLTKARDMDTRNLAAVTDERDALKADKERLDWVEKVMPQIGRAFWNPPEQQIRLVVDGHVLPDAPTLRAAIDAALGKEKS